MVTETRNNRSWLGSWRRISLFLFLASWLSANAEEAPLIDISSAVPTVVVDARYAGSHNFVGAPVDGYLEAKVLLTKPAIEALRSVQAGLAEFGLGLKVFDGYRPQRAVDHFVRWARDLEDTETKDEFYPRVDKANLFSDGYIAERSGHSRGSTVDLTLVDLDTGRELDMGTPWDFFDLTSWPSSKKPSAKQRANRALLRSVMIAQNFRSLETEWWHFTLNDEPYPESYFDQVID